LLTHTSGLPLTVITERIDQFENLFAQANAAGEAGPEFPTGSKFWYSDAGSDVLGAIVEVVSGTPLNEFWEKELFEPLGMNDTFVALDAADPRFARIASLYIGSPGEWTRYWTAADGKPFYPFAWGSQTAHGTAIDYAKFLAMWMDGGQAGAAQILSREAIARTLEPVSPMKMLGSDERFPTDFDALEMYYGRLAQVYVPKGNPESKPVIIGHSGSDGTMAWAWPEEDLMILYFTQSRGGSSVLRMEEEIERLFFADQIVAEEGAEEFAPYLGTYIANFPPFDGEEFQVLVKNGKLALDVPSQMVFELITRKAKPGGSLQ
jgi:CubicO group peptidase (beta-lactamase class C family)